MSVIDISRFDPAAKKNILLNNLIVHAGGHGFVQPDDTRYMRPIDYYNGKPLKIDISGNVLNPYCYDRDNGGAGTALNVVEKLLEFIDNV